MAEFKDRLTEALNNKNISAAELSRLADVNEGAISQYRKGAYKATQENLERLAKALDVSIAWLIGADAPSKSEALIIGKHNTALKDVLKQLREEKGYTQADLGKKLGVSKSTISMWENGCRFPRFEDLETIADFFGVSLDVFREKNNVSTFNESSFKYRLEESLIKTGITPAELSRLSGVDEGTISNYRKGKYEPKPKKLKLIADALNVSFEWLAGNGISTESAQSAPEKHKKSAVFSTTNILNDISDFELTFSGDSMINARIFDGDTVYIHCQPAVENGDIAAVLIDDKITLKKVYKTATKFILSSCNPMYDDIVYMNNELNQIKILGKAVAFTSILK